MNLGLFVRQLNQLLQQETEATLEDVCELLSTHIFAAVTIADQTDSFVMPIIVGDTNNNGDVFNEDETLAIGIAVSVCTVLMRQKIAGQVEEAKRKREAVRNLINTLSFSELEAAVQMVKEIAVTGKKEGLLVAGSIADKIGCARSVVTNALKKLEVANLAETRSLGMKGTYIRILDEILIEELAKM